MAPHQPCHPETKTDADYKNWKAHIRWTGPQIIKQLPEITLICAGMGTSGTDSQRLYQKS